MQTTLILLEVSKLSMLLTMTCFIFIIVHRKMMIPKYVDFLLGLCVLFGTGKLLSCTGAVSTSEVFYQVSTTILIVAFTFRKYKIDIKHHNILKLKN